MSTISWEQYRGKYRNFLMSMYQAQLTSIAAGAALESCPANLPTQLREGLLDAMRAAAGALQKAVEDLETSPHQERTRHAIAVPENARRAFAPLMGVYLVCVQEGIPTKEIDYQGALYRQQLVMIIAHFESFLGDSLRAICYAKPSIIESSQKQISWSAALANPSREMLFATLADNFASSLTKTKELRTILGHLSRELGLKIDIKDSFVSKVSLAEQVRHIIVHNGGNIDLRFLEKTCGRQTVGTKYRVDELFIEETANAALMISQDIFEAISIKFFCVKEPLMETGHVIGPDNEIVAAASAGSEHDN